MVTHDQGLGQAEQTPTCEVWGWSPARSPVWTHSGSWALAKAVQLKLKGIFLGQG